MSTAVDWTTARPALGAWFETVTGLHADPLEGSAKWGGSLKKATPRHSKGLLHLVEGGFIGWPSHEKEQPGGQPAGEEIVPHVRGIREVVWEIRVRSQRNTAGVDSRHYLAIVEAHLHNPGPTGFTALASTLGLGLQAHGGIVDLTETMGNRRVSISQLDVRLHAYVDVSMTPYGYIETLDVETKWRDPNGDLLPAEFQFIGEIP